MPESAVVEQLIEFTTITLTGVSLIFSVVSAYVVALNYFIGSANLMARLGSFLFISLVLGMLLAVMLGAQTTQMGLIERLREIDQAGELTAAGRAVLVNATPEAGAAYSIDQFVRWCSMTGLLFVYLALGYLTFLHHWTPDAIPVTIEQRDAS
jgi:hypothetical protein